MKRRDVLKALSLAPLGILPFSGSKAPRTITWEEVLGKPLLKYLYEDRPLPPLKDQPYLSQQYKSDTEKYGPQLGEWKYKSHDMWREVKRDSKGQAISHKIEYEDERGRPCVRMEGEYGKPKGWRIFLYREGKVLIPKSGMVYLDKDTFQPYRAWGICNLGQTRYDNFAFEGTPWEKGEYRIECPVCLKDWQYSVNIEQNQDGRYQYRS
jgi:hypothetical protein